MVFRVSFADLEVEPGNRSIWRCPHCNKWFGLRKSFYYRDHYNARCQSQQVPFNEAEQDGSDQWQDDPEGAAELGSMEYDIDGGLASYGLDAVQQYNVLLLMQEVEQRQADATLQC
jgi:hypothetical protein